ncbi:hypothetical protein [Ideonella sp. YS5]|uniref:hypothetical protein n=1 Tax=Ideonella sp. YS5 TaxID=3453714 RepID=UPI003EEF4169
MKKLKSERHHWWPECLSKHWAAEDGKTGWLKPNGNCVRLPPANLGVIRDGHHIKMGGTGSRSAWGESFEDAFDKADSSFPDLIEWLEGLERKHVHDVPELRHRFIAQPCTEDRLLLMTECAVSLAVRGPLNREASVAPAEHFCGPLRSAERATLIGLNMWNSQRVVADSIGAEGKFVAVYSQDREFIFGDGFFHNVANAQMAPHSPKMFVPITPHICILVCRPWSYMPEPKFSTLVLEDDEVDICNHAVQAYSRNAIFFRCQQPQIHEAFRRGEHLRYDHPGNPIDSLIHSIPGVHKRDTSLDHFFDRKAKSGLD